MQSAEDVLQHTRFSDDMATVNQARLVMGLVHSEEGDSGKDSNVGNEDDDCGKRKRDESEVEVEQCMLRKHVSINVMSATLSSDWVQRNVIFPQCFK